MSFKLMVNNLPQNISNDDFKNLFSEIKGFRDARLIYNEKNLMFENFKIFFFYFLIFTKKKINMPKYQIKNINKI